MSNKKVVLVVGATGAIGIAICNKLANEGYAIGFIGRDRDKIETLEAKLSSFCEAKGFSANIENYEEVVDVIDQMYNYFGHVDHLVQAAGGSPAGTLFELDELSWYDTWNVKLMGTVRVIKALALRSIENLREGSFVIINGTFSREQSPVFPVNAAVNTALSGLSKAAANELARHQIRVNVINPGATDSPLWTQVCSDLAAIKKTDAKVISEAHISTIPLGRLANTTDIASAVSFLLSSDSKYITGTEITVDGGACHSL
jgi:2,3-dihydro-2,3-dihydroxybenzoate dehydrogenase